MSNKPEILITDTDSFRGWLYDGIIEIKGNLGTLHSDYERLAKQNSEQYDKIEKNTVNIASVKARCEAIQQGKNKDGGEEVNILHGVLKFKGYKLKAALAILVVGGFVAVAILTVAKYIEVERLQAKLAEVHDDNR